MEKSPRLSSELVQLCGQPGQWRDVRHLQTLAWMVGGLIQAEGVKFTTWRDSGASPWNTVEKLTF